MHGDAVSQHHKRMDRARWLAARLAALIRDGKRCRECSAPADEIDHVVPMFKGGDPYDIDNLVSLCTICHLMKTKAEARPLGPLATELMAWANDGD